MAALDGWAESHEVSRSEAIRRLVELGLNEEIGNMISALIGALSIIVFGAICFCLAAIVQRVLPSAGLGA